YKFEYEILGGAALVLFGIFIGSICFTGEKPIFNDTSGYWANFWMTMFGVLFTILVLDKRAERRQEKALKEQLIRDVGSRVNDVAIRAIEELNVRQWLEDGSLSHRKFSMANLQGANLAGANLRGAWLSSYLQKANLQEADLSGANLLGANLQ